MTMPANEPAAANDHVIDQGLGLMGGADQAPQLPQQPEAPKLNPAWDNLLGAIPQGLHGQMIPELKKWDQNYEQGIQKVHSQYAGYKPFLDGQIAPEQLNEAYMIRQSMEQDPMKFVQAVIEFYKLQLPTEQGQQLPNEPQDLDDENPYDVTQNPEFQRYQQMTETMANALIEQNRVAQEAQEDSELENAFQAAKQKHGDFDEQWVMQHLYMSGHENANEQIMDEAVAAYKEHVQNIVQNYRSPSQQAPVLMGSGGGVPSQNVPVGSMNGNQRRALVVQTLQNLNANSGG